MMPHTAFVSPKELFPQHIEIIGFRRDAQGNPQHPARTGPYERTIARMFQRMQATINAQLIGCEAKIGGTIEQRTVQIKQYRIDLMQLRTHTWERRVASM